MYKKTGKLIFTAVISLSLTNISALADESMLMTDNLKNNDFRAYDTFSALQFENDDSLPAYWCADGGVLQYVKNDPEKTAYSGSGAMYADTSNGYVSAWGGPGGINGARIGETISGYFYYKKLSEPEGLPRNYQFPKIRLYNTLEGESEESNFCITENFDSASISNAPLNEWIRVEIRSTGKVVTPENIGHIEYSITMGQDGHQFMIDNIVFGGYRSSASPYDIFKHLTFEPNLLPDGYTHYPSKWTGEGAQVEFKINDSEYKAHTGAGAMYINSEGENAYYSVWDGHYGFAEIWPSAGDITSGYFYIKKLRQTDNPLPDLRIYSGENIPENYFCSTEPGKKMSDLPLNEWTRIDLVPTGRPLCSPELLQFNMTSDYVGDEYMIDDITLEKIDYSYTLPEKWSSYIETNSGATTTFYNGKIYIIGGKNDLNGIKIYDIESNTWSDGAAMPTPVYEHNTIICNEKLYIMGGYELNSSALSNKVQIYDVKSNTWSDGGIMPRSTANQTATIYADKIYIAGGDGEYGENTLMLRDKDANAWYSGAAEMPMPVSGHDAQIKDLKIYITGGENNGQPVNKLQIYDILTDDWINGADMPCPVTEHKVLYNSGKFYVIGGKTTNSQPSDKIQIYDIKSNTWRTGPDIPAENAVNSAVYFNGKIYVFCTGEKVQIYDISSNTWSAGSNCGVVPDFAFLYNDCIYLADETNVKAYGQYSRDDNSNSVVSENEIVLTNDTGKTNVYVEVQTDSLKDKLFTMNYPADKFILEDVCVLTSEKETEPGLISGTDINLLEMSAGEIKFKVNKEIPAGKWLSGMINGFTFQGLGAGSGTVTCKISQQNN